MICLSDNDIRRIAIANPQHCVSMAQLRQHRRAQRAARNNMTVANAAPRVDNHEIEIAPQPHALKAIIENDEVDALVLQQFRPCKAVGRHSDRCMLGDQQRLIADVPRQIMVSIDNPGAGTDAAKTPRDHTRLQFHFLGGIGDCH